MRQQAAKRQARQGDLFFVRVEKLPDGKQTAIKSGAIVHSDATNHTHQLRRRDRAQLISVGAEQFISATGVAHIDHEEHRTIAIGKGLWRVVRQREYEPAGWRTVVD